MSICYESEFNQHMCDKPIQTTGGFNILLTVRFGVNILLFLYKHALKSWSSYNVAQLSFCFFLL